MRTYRHKYGAILLACVLGCFVAVCQEKENDSLLRVIQSATVDTVRINSLKKLGINLMESEPDRSIAYGLQALQTAQKAKLPLKEAECLQFIGVAYDFKGNLDSCLHYLRSAVALYRDLRDEAGEANVINDIGAAYHYRGNYELALRNYLTALNYKKRANDLRSMAPMLNNIGLIYRAKKDYQTAIQFFTESGDIKRNLNDEKGLVFTYMNLGSLYYNRGDYDSSYLYSRKCLELSEKLKLEQDIAGAQSNIGKALLKMNRASEAEQISLQALQLAEKTKCWNCLYTIYQTLGNVEMARRNFGAAKTYFNRGLQHARETERTEPMMTFYRDLAETMLREGDYRRAFFYRDSAEALSEKMLNEENIRHLNEMNTVYQTSEKENQILLLNAETEKGRIMLTRTNRERNYFLISSILLLLLAGVAYFAYVSNHRKNKLVNRQKELISKSLAEKDILLREIHHRVKNNLQLVSSLLSLQSNYIKDEMALDAVKESRNRVYSMALIHQNLYQEDNLTSIQVQDYIHKLCNNLRDSYRGNHVELEEDVQPLWLDVEAVIPLGLIINELVTNSFKYAFPDERDGKIRISLYEKEDKLFLSVYDNGVGMPPGIDPLSTDTFGFKMIKAFIHKMKGTINIYTEDGSRSDLVFTQYKPIADV